MHKWPSFKSSLKRGHGWFSRKKHLCSFTHIYKIKPSPSRDKRWARKKIGISLTTIRTKNRKAINRSQSLTNDLMKDTTIQMTWQIPINGWYTELCARFKWISWIHWWRKIVYSRKRKLNCGHIPLNPDDERVLSSDRRQYIHFLNQNQRRIYLRFNNSNLQPKKKVNDKGKTIHEIV